MTQATLTLNGIAPLHGTVETGGDYIRFRTDGPLADEPEPLHKGQIEMEGRTEKVMVKTVGSRTDSSDGVEVTLQRFEPSPG